MKRSALQCIAGFVGAILVVVGVVWTCKQLSSPTQLNAAQSQTSSRMNTSRSETPTQKNSFSPSQDSGVRLNKKGAIGSVSHETPALINNSTGSVPSPISQGSSLEILTPAPNTPVSNLGDDMTFSDGVEETTGTETEEFPVVSTLSLLTSNDDVEVETTPPLPSPANIQNEFVEEDKDDAFPTSLPTSSLSLQALDEDAVVPVLDANSTDEF